VASELPDGHAFGDAEERGVALVAPSREIGARRLRGLR
jgi:hypothetical protein